MKKGIVGMLLMVLLTCCASGMAEAAVFIDFDTAPLTPDTSGGAYTHTLSTAYGDIVFGGRIWNYLDGELFPDHTTGGGYFLKNTVGESKVTMIFDFDVASIDLWWVGISGATFNGAVYDASGDSLEGGSDSADGKWTHVFTSPGTPIRSIAFWGDNNKIAVDDITITPLCEVIPEPASVALLGLGLVGVARLRRRRS